MISRRDFLQVGMAASALVGGSGFGSWAKLAAQQALQMIAGSSGPRTAERWRRFAEDFRSERQ